MDEIITKDMYLAAILISYGSQIVMVDKADPHRQFFHFDRLPQTIIISGNSGDPESIEIKKLSDLRSHYLSKKIFFPPSFVDCLRSVKSYIYSE